MCKMKKLAWYLIYRGRMDKRVQEKFEKAQKLADDTGQPVTITVKLKVMPPKDPKEPEYQPIQYTVSMPEPAYKSKELDLVRINNVAVADSEVQPDQEHLQLGDESKAATTPKSAPAAAERAPVP